MPAESRQKARTPYAPAIELPPVYRLVTLREVGDAFAHAKRIAADEGAGTLVFVGRLDLAEFAVVMEPDEPLRLARRAFYAGCVALADAIASAAPPEKPMSLEWPDAVVVDRALVGGARLGWPDGASEDARPDWLVFGATIRMVSMTDAEPGLRPLSSALEDEGFDGTGAEGLLESFARHLMLVTDTWQERGFGAVAREYVARLPAQSGVRRDIDENGDLLIRRTGRGDIERRALLPALRAPSWLDPKTGGLRA
jgi:biotin-(acetyl-CoA carboxylase) ligase